MLILNQVFAQLSKNYTIYASLLLRDDNLNYIIKISWERESFAPLAPSIDALEKEVLYSFQLHNSKDSFSAVLFYLSVAYCIQVIVI